MKIWILTGILLTSSSLLKAGELPADVRGFLDHHCMECHDDLSAKGDLDLYALEFDPADPVNFAKWKRIHDRVRDGEMPPKDEPRPGQGDLNTFVASLSEPLMKADRADVAEKGRVRTRRLTRREYEHTMHDLLGIDLPLHELLPEDPMSHGFETVAHGQQLSHHQMARYLDVADIALDEAFDRALEGDANYKTMHTPKDLAKRSRGNYRGPELRDGESISWPIGLQFFGRMPVTKVPADGWYRVTVKNVRAINPGKNGAVWGTLRSGTCFSNAPILYMVGLVEATRQPRDLVFEAWIREDHMLELKPNDATLKRAPTGARGGNVSFKDRDLKKQGFAGIAHKGIQVERIYPNADRQRVRRNLFGDVDLEQAEKNPEAALDQLVDRFAQRAFRRPLSGEKLAPYREIGRRALAEGESLPEALRASYRTILCSPRFLSFIEEPGKLDGHAVASRLSYALWLSMPDGELIKLADEGKLSEPEVLREQIDRMLTDPKAERFIASFTDQWLKLKEINFTTPDRRLYATFDPVVQESMLRESRAYVAELIREDLGVDHFVDSDFVFWNERLARLYRLDAPVEAGSGVQRVSLPAGKQAVRGGIVTQGAILKVTADGTVTSPVVRGVFVNERILGAHIAPPPPNVPAIEPDIRGAKSIRDQLAKHRSSESCNACHQTIDPPGFALENFDPIGAWRSKYGKGGKGAPVNPSGVTPGGEEFAGLVEWKKIYAARDEQLARGFARQFLTYATGAPIRFSDRPAVEEVVDAAAESNYGLRSLIRGSLTSPVFLNK